MQAHHAQGGVYVAAHGQPSDNARSFAREHGITLLQGDALGALLLVYVFRYGKAMVVAPLTNAGAPMMTALMAQKKLSP